MDHDGSKASPAQNPACFMHVPKCAGMSIIASLRDALPPEAFAPWMYDAPVLGDFDAALLKPKDRAAIVIGPEEVRALGNYRAIVGHFCLDTLLAVTHPDSICTVLREPRARLLSVYMYWRVPGLDFGGWHGLRPLSECLSTPQVAHHTDNKLCRMLLDGDPRLPRNGFASQSDVAGIAADAIERLMTLGFVGVLEVGDVWDGIGEIFGVRLRPARVNVTRDLAPIIMRPGEALVDSDTLDLIEQRCAADAIVYDYVLARTGKDEAERARVRRTAFATALVQLGDLVGNSETADSSAATIQRLSDDLQRSRAELELTREWLSSIQHSASWRVTAPLRATKRRLGSGNPLATD